MQDKDLMQKAPAFFRYAAFECFSADMARLIGVFFLLTRYSSLPLLSFKNSGDRLVTGVLGKDGQTRVFCLMILRTLMMTCIDMSMTDT